MDPREQSRAAGSFEQAKSDFSLVLGGPLFQLLRRSRPTEDVIGLVKKRLVFISLLTWLPLLVLATAQGKLIRGSVALPFSLDIELHVRFLVALPLLVIAELVVHERMRAVVQLFRDRNLIPEHALAQFNEAIESSFRLRNSVVAELGLVAIVYGVGIQLVWRQFIALGSATWYATPEGGGTTLTLAGLWYGYVSLPIFQFLFVRWYFRIFIWARFLFRVSKIELCLVPTHPDRLGGLGFLAETVHAFMPLAVAHGVMLAGPFANRIFYAGAKFSDFRLEAVTLVVVVLCVVFGPLLVFVPQLAQARQNGMQEYGTLAQHCASAFDAKWLRGGAAQSESLLGSSDSQSLADLSRSFEVVRSMRTVPVTKEAAIRLAAATFAPIVPLALTMMPLEELVKRLFGMLF